MVSKFQPTPIIGPAIEPAQRPDVTLLFDVSEQWPQPNDCPDWPLYLDEQNRAMNSVGGPRDAEARLGVISNWIRSRGCEIGMVPSDDQRAEIKAMFFRDGNPPNWRWSQLGFSRLTPTVGGTDMAEIIVEAVHIRGYLRKLEAQKVKSAEASERATIDRLRRAVDSAKTSIPAMEQELANLGEAEARHAQRIADERAVGRARDLRSSIQSTISEASIASAKLADLVPATEVAA